MRALGTKTVAGVGSRPTRRLQAIWAGVSHRSGERNAGDFFMFESQNRVPQSSTADGLVFPVFAGCFVLRFVRLLV